MSNLRNYEKRKMTQFQWKKFKSSEITSDLRILRHFSTIFTEYIFKIKPNILFVGKAFKWASSLSKHMKHHTRHKILNCPYCPKYYVERRSLNIHLRSHTGKNVKTFSRRKSSKIKSLYCLQAIVRTSVPTAIR